MVAPPWRAAIESVGMTTTLAPSTPGTTDGRPRPIRCSTRRPLRPSSSERPDPANLVDRARAGDQAAWTEMVARFTPMMRQVALGVGVSSSVADDAVQSAWLKLTRSIDSIQQPERLAGWLRVAARNEAVNSVRGNWRLVCSDDLEQAMGSVDSVDQLVSADEVVAVREAMSALNDRQREVVSLRYLDEVKASYAEIAEQLSMSEGAIGPTIGRALDRMGRHPAIAAVR